MFRAFLALLLCELLVGLPLPATPPLKEELSRPVYEALQEAKDRLRSEHDYRVNLKAELEIRLLHTKLDQLLTHQWQRLLEIQQLQVDLIEDLSSRGIARKPVPPGSPAP